MTKIYCNALLLSRPLCPKKPPFALLLVKIVIESNQSINHKMNLLSQSSLEHLISLDLVSTKLYCLRARVHCYYCLCYHFLSNPVRRSEELRGGPNQ